MSDHGNLLVTDGDGEADRNGGDAAEKDAAGVDPEDDVSRPRQSLYLDANLCGRRHRPPDHLCHLISKAAHQQQGSCAPMSGLVSFPAVTPTSLSVPILCKGAHPHSIPVLPLPLCSCLVKDPTTQTLGKYPRLLSCLCSSF